MKPLGISTVALTLALLAGCGGLQTVPQNATPLAKVHQSGKSWMLPEASGEDLLYVGDSSANDYVYSYPQFKLVGKLNLDQGQGPFYTEGLCADGNGNVFVPGWTWNSHIVRGYVYEFAHGGTEPIQTLTSDTNGYISCAFDATTGNLAVTTGGGVDIFRNAQGVPTSYSGGSNVHPEWATYDPNGDLFVSGEEASVGVLPQGGSDLEAVTFNYPFYAASVQWNDGYLTIVSLHKRAGVEPVYRTQISGTSGTIVGTTGLRGHRWGYIGNGQVLIEGKKIMGAGNNHYNLSVWRYPKGGNPLKTPVKHVSVWGLVISHALSHSRTRH